MDGVGQIVPAAAGYRKGRITDVVCSRAPLNRLVTHSGTPRALTLISTTREPAKSLAIAMPSQRPRPCVNFLECAFETDCQPDESATAQLRWIVDTIESSQIPARELARQAALKASDEVLPPLNGVTNMLKKDD